MIVVVVRSIRGFEGVVCGELGVGVGFGNVKSDCARWVEAGVCAEPSSLGGLDGF